MDREDFVCYLTAVGVDLEQLAELDRTDPTGPLHAPADRTRFWRVVTSAAREDSLSDADARWLAGAVDGWDTAVVDAVADFTRRRDADARDQAYQTRPDPLPDHLARPRM